MGRRVVGRVLRVGGRVKGLQVQGRRVVGRGLGVVGGVLRVVGRLVVRRVVKRVVGLATGGIGSRRKERKSWGEPGSRGISRRQHATVNPQSIPANHLPKGPKMKRKEEA